MTSVDLPAAQSAPEDGRQSELRTDLALSIVVVTYRSAKTLPALWDSLRSELATVGAGEVFFVDNASDDGTLDHLRGIRERASTELGATWQIHVIANAENVGYGRACNQAISMSAGERVLLLNPDTRLEPGALFNAVRYLRRHPDVGIVGPKILLPNGRLDAPCRRSFKTPAIYFYKLTGLSRLFPRSRRFGRYYLTFEPEDRQVEVDAVIGAFLLIRREVVRQIGLLDERFFMYCEDEDWCFRAKEAGWRVMYVPDAVVWHVKGASARTERARMIYEWHRSIYLFHRKNMAGSYAGWVNTVMYGGMLVSLVQKLVVYGCTRALSAARGCARLLAPTRQRVD